MDAKEAHAQALIVRENVIRCRGSLRSNISLLEGALEDMDAFLKVDVDSKEFTGKATKMRDSSKRKINAMIASLNEIAKEY